MTHQVLIVDDDVENCRLTSVVLQRHGFSTIIAHNGREALDILANELPDLIVLDIMMGELSGYEVCERIRANPRTADIPVIMFTAKSMVDDRLQGYEAGADEYLTKPTHPSKLAETVNNVIEQKTHKRQGNQAFTGVTTGFLGIKGGVGTTTFALNIALQLSQLFHKTILSDFCQGYGTLGHYTGQSTLGMTRLFTTLPQNVQATQVETELTQYKPNLSVLASSSEPRNIPAQNMTETYTAILQGMQGVSEHVIIDLGSRFDRTIKQLHSHFHQFVLIADPTQPAIQMLKNILWELEYGIQDKRIRVVFVQRHIHPTPIDYVAIESLIGRHIDAIIPAEAQLESQAVNTITPMSILNPSASIVEQYRQFATLLHEVATSLAS